MAPDLPRQVTGFAAIAGTVIDHHRLEARAVGREIGAVAAVNRVNATVYMAVLTDVTTLAVQEQRLFADRRKFLAIFDYVRDYAIYTITLDGIDGRMESLAAALRRVAAPWMCGVATSACLPAGGSARARHWLAAGRGAAHRLGGDRGLARTRDNSRLWANTVVTALPDGDGTVRGFVLVSRDITERKRTEDDLKLLATVDSLTGADNRRQGDVLLLGRIQPARARWATFAVMMLDIDHFKAVNDRLATPPATRCCARWCSGQRALRAIDMLARWGGEEFWCCCPTATRVRR